MPDSRVASSPDSQVASFPDIQGESHFPYMILYGRNPGGAGVHKNLATLLVMMKSYRELEIYQLSRKLAIEVHKASLTLPKYELYEEGQQVRRSSKAVTTAIVEGYARRRYKADYILRLVYSQAECDETILHLDFIIETHSLTDSIFSLLRPKYDELSKMINRYTSWVENHFVY